MVRSMTGFAHAQGEDGTRSIRVTVKALNHRFLDLHLRVPAELEPFEPRWRSLVRERIHRGHLEVDFQVESREKPALEVNTEFVRAYVELYRNLQREFGLTGEPDLAAALRQPGVLRVNVKAADPEAAQQLGALAEQLLKEALDRLDQMRRNEGAALERDLLSVLQQVRERRNQLLTISKRALPAFHKHLSERLQELLRKTDLDPSRLAEEAAYLAERSDTSEELARLESHVEQFANLLAGEAASGKRLDFLLQEMNRETNTILSKAPGLAEEGLEMTKVGLELKALIERLREQVQNVE
ncbi:MAG TPA: YicC/YloC family endoribonuclease [Candidatus Xenobia bacterium]|nr:YicC/YloC family endoribonuclease [Candidatus Xenobia bacterium]